MSAKVFGGYVSEEFWCLHGYNYVGIKVMGMEKQDVSECFDTFYIIIIR